MSGPVWRFDSGISGICDVCLRHVERMYTEGAVGDNALRPARRICLECYARYRTLLVAGETGARSVSPAYFGVR